MPRKTNKTKVTESLHETKELMENANAENGVSVTDIMSMLSGDQLPANNDSESYVPIHTLQSIKDQLGKQVVKIDDSGNKIFENLYSQEKKAQLVFSLLAERGINLLDHLDTCLEEVGYNTSVVASINETMTKVAETLRNIGEIQFRKAKLENERTHLEIQKYKADLKKREIDIKEQVASQGNLGNGSQIIAVGSPQELLEIMNGEKGVESIKKMKVLDDKEIEVSVEGEGNGEA